MFFACCAPLNGFTDREKTLTHANEFLPYAFFASTFLYVGSAPFSFRMHSAPLMILTFSSFLGSDVLFPYEKYVLPIFILC